MKPAEDSGKANLRDEDDIIRRLGTEAGLNSKEAAFYLKLLRDGSVPASAQPELARILLGRGMVIVSGDGERLKPVHPRLGIANCYRTWREAMVREINERRMRIDKLIIELIPVYEAATEKRSVAGGP
jgi:hypothetical protein